jgi:hypothetical protein
MFASWFVHFSKAQPEKESVGITSNSLCDLGELGVSVADFTNKSIYHRDAELTEEAQRKTSISGVGMLNLIDCKRLFGAVVLIVSADLDQVT